MSSSKKSISVILPNYNGKHLMELYIPSVIEALHFSKIDYEFFVIDDCSTDDSVSFIKENHPDIILLKNERNKGFSFTCNHGIRKASKDLVFLLNSDVKLTPNYFDSQWRYFDSPSTFGVMGRIMNFNGDTTEDTARLPRYKGAKFKANTFYYSENNQNTIYTTYLSGANALINREKINLLKGFNEIYSPFYFEDFDLGLRAWKMGWKSYYEHQSICYHRVSATTNNVKKSNFVKITYNRNSFILQAIHLDGLRRFFWYMQLFSTTLIGHLLKGEFWILNSLSQFLKNKNDISQNRKEISTMQKQLNSDVSLDSIISIIHSSTKGKNIKYL